MGRMDHRCGSRQPVCAAVTLYPHASGPVAGRVREVSISGMFVETAPEFFCDNSVIDVELTLPCEVDLHTFRWPVMVVRRTDDGLGLMFDRLRPPAICRLIANIESGLPTGPANIRSLPPRAAKKQPQL